jgi:hypothetical protein
MYKRLTVWTYVWQLSCEQVAGERKKQELDSMVVLDFLSCGTLKPTPRLAQKI